MPSFARKKNKKKDTVTNLSLQNPQRLTLSYNDSRRFDYFFLEAVKQQLQGYYTAAMDLYLHCLEIDSTSSVCYYQLARYYSSLNQDSLMGKYIEKAVTLEPDNVTYLTFLGGNLVGKKRIDDAIEVYERIAQINKSDGDILRFLLKLYRHTDNHAMALDVLNRMQTVEGVDEENTLDKMYELQQMGRTSKALEELDLLISKHPYDQKFKVMKANWLVQNGNPKESYRLLQKVLLDDPDNAMAQASLYDYYQENGQDSLANSMMMKLLLNPNTQSDERVNYLLAVYHRVGENGNDSVSLLNLMNDVLAASPYLIDVAEMKEAYMELLKMPQDSLDAANRYILEYAPENESARYRYAVSLWDQHRYEEMLSVAQAGIDYHPQELVFHYIKTVALMNMEREDEVLATLINAVEKCDMDANKNLSADIYVLLGDTYHKKGFSEEAYAAYDKCLALDPEHSNCLNNYAYFLAQDDRELDKAEQMSRLSIEKEPDNANNMDTYAWVMYKRGDYLTAKEFIDKTMEIEKNNKDTVAEGDSIKVEGPSATVLEHAGDIYYKLGYEDSALSFWYEAVEKHSDSADLPKKIEMVERRKKK